MAQRTERSRFRIGELLVHPDRKIVIRDGEEIHLETRWMQVLVYLAEHNNTTIGTLQLMHAVWGSTAFEEGAVHSAISKLRKKVLRDDLRTPRYIETIPGQGYRLIAPVTFPNDYVRNRGGGCSWAGNPYVGLDAFDEAHAKVFCGRGAAIDRVIVAMRAQFENQKRFVLVVGASGSGKTSLLRAGVIPLLTRKGGADGLHALSVARRDLGTTSDGDSLGALAAAIAEWTLDQRPVFDPQPLDSLKKFLAGPKKSIHEIIDRAFNKYSPSLDKTACSHLLLVLDHCEALISTRDRDTSPEKASLNQKSLDTFAHALEVLCSHPRVLATMIVRADFYPKLIDTIPTLIERKGSMGHVDVGRPTAIEVNELISLPATIAGLAFERDPESHAAHHLNDTLAEAARGQVDVLPLLQHTLHELYMRCQQDKNLTYAAYRDIGGLEGAIARRAEEVFASLADNAQASLHDVLGQLVVIEPDSDAIRGRPGFRDRLSSDGTKLVQAFIDARLFATDGSATFCVAHEALLRQWPRAREWANENKRIICAKERVEKLAETWKKSGKKNDHLLNSGAPLSEAVEVLRSEFMKADKDTIEFISMSKSLSEKKIKIRAAIFAMMIILTATSMTTTGIAIFLERKSEKNSYFSSIQSASIQKILSSIFSTPNVKAIEPQLIDFNGQTKAAFEKYPNSEEIASEYNMSNYWLGNLYTQTGEIEKSKKFFFEYLKIAIKLRNSSGYNYQHEAELSYAYNNVGQIFLKQGETKRAIFYFEKSMSLKEEIIKNNYNTNNEILIDYADTISWAASAQEADGDISASEESLMRQERILKKEKESTGAAGEATRLLANAYWRICRIKTARGAYYSAENYCKKGVIEFLEFSKKETDQTKRQLANIYLQYFRTKMSQADENGAVEMIKLAKNKIEEIEMGNDPVESWLRLRHTIFFEFYLHAQKNETQRRYLVNSEIKKLRELYESNRNQEQFAIDYAYALVESSLLLEKKNSTLFNQNMTAAIAALSPYEIKSKNFDILSIITIARDHTGKSSESGKSRAYLESIGYKFPPPLKPE